MYECMYVWVYVCVCVYIYIYIEVMRKPYVWAAGHMWAAALHR